MAVDAASTESFIQCELNDTNVYLPTETIKTMAHCLHLDHSKIPLLVEIAHINWMIKRLSETRGKKFFLDIGAATGAALIPIADQNRCLSIIAFEPAKTAMKLLQATLEKIILTL